MSASDVMAGPASAGTSEAGGVSRAVRAFAGKHFGGFILAFHDIAPDQFGRLVESMAPDEPVSLSVLVERVCGGRSTAGLFAITVDDGVGGTVRALSGVARERQWPITFYLPTGYVDGPAGMAFQLLRCLMARVPAVRLELRRQVVDLSTGTARRRFERRLLAAMHTAPPGEYAGLLDEMAAHAVARGWMAVDDSAPRPISWPEVAGLAADPAVSFESHGVSHTAAAALSPAALERELKESQSRIQECTGRPCRHFAYPFGSPRSIGRVAPAVVGQYYRSAVTMSRGRLGHGPPHLLPRIPLYPIDTPARARLKVLTW